jgi:hypothetical protein
MQQYLASKGMSLKDKFQCNPHLRSILGPVDGNTKNLEWGYSELELSQPVGKNFEENLSLMKLLKNYRGVHKNVLTL